MHIIVLTKIEVVGHVCVCVCVCLHARVSLCVRIDFLSRWNITHLCNTGFYLSHKCIFYPLSVGSSTTCLHTLCRIIVCYCCDFICSFISRSETLWSFMSGISCSSSPSLPPSLVCTHTTQGQMGGYLISAWLTARAEKLKCFCHSDADCLQSS